MFANAADMNGMDRYQGAFDSVRNNPRPEHIIGGVVRRAPVDLTNLLNVTTPIDVDASGNMVARTSDPQLARSKPIAAVNLWAFGGRGNTQVEAVGGRAYLLAGKQPDRDKIMNNLAANDYLLSHRIAVPGKPDISVAASQGDSLFVPALEKMERDIPDKFVDWEKKKTHRYPLSRADLERRVSLVREDGAISPLAVPKRTGSSGGFFKRLLGR
jgi:hypothetical protein